jgi:parallel beta-helix repeat protein
MMREGEAYGNESHGMQMRGQSVGVLRSCRLGDNSGSGLALFDKAQTTATELVAEGNELNGVQCGDAARLSLFQTEVLGNMSSGLAGFGRSRLSLEQTTLGGSAGYGAQISQSCGLQMAECTLCDNRKGGLLLAEQASSWLSGCTLADNGLHGVAVSDCAGLTLLDCSLSGNGRDGVMLLGQGSCQLLRNVLLANGRHGLFAARGARPLLSENRAQDNVVEQILVEGTALGLEAPPSLEEPAGVTLTAEGGGSLTLPFQPKPIEESMLLALLRHGRLSEAALGKAAKSRRVGGAMENLIDRLNKAGLPVLRHDGEGPEGNVYALKLDISRVRQTPGGRAAQQEQGREIC